MISSIQFIVGIMYFILAIMIIPSSFLIIDNNNIFIMIYYKFIKKIFYRNIYISYIGIVLINRS